MTLPLDRFFASFPPDMTVLIATSGVCLIFVEFNRPGRAVPGALGLLLTLLAIAHLARFGARPWAILLLSGCTAVYLTNLWRSVPAWLLAIATVAVVAGLRFLIPAEGRYAVSAPVATLCGGLLGTASATLTRVAHRARRLKALD